MPTPTTNIMKKCQQTKCKQEYTAVVKQKEKSIKYIDGLLAKVANNKMSYQEYIKKLEEHKKEVINSTGMSELIDCYLKQCKNDLNKMIATIQRVLGQKAMPVNNKKDYIQLLRKM
jgi:sialic acid synthase SpsE